jgi:hypothetical protein
MTTSEDASAADLAPLPYVTVDAGACEPAAREVKVAVGNPATKKSVERAIAIADTPAAARARLLALAVVELLRASLPGLSRSDPPPPEPPPPPPVAPASAPEAPPRTPAVPPPSSPPRAHLWAGIELRALASAGQPLTALAGGRAGASIALPPRPLRLIADVGCGYGRGTDPLGSIDLVVASGSLGLAAEWALWRARVEVGLKAEPGAAWAAGHPWSPRDRGSSTLGFVLAAASEGTLRAPLTDRASLLVTASLGGVVRGLTLFANARSAAGFAGGVLGLRAGADFDL